MRSFTNNPIVNIVRAELLTKETEPRLLCFDTVSSAAPEPFISEGEEEELRVGNTILAQNCLEDIIKGYNITLKDCVLSKELFALSDGGEALAASAVGFAGYSAPVAGGETSRTRFTLRLYTAEKDYGGENVGIFRFSYPNCFGTPVKLSFGDGEFAAPEYLVRSRPSAGESAMKIECMDTLPVLTASAAELPEAPVTGYCIVATAAFTAGSVQLAVGETAYFDGTAYVKTA